MKIWQDVRDTRNSLGVKLWLQGGELRLGKRVYRVRWFND